MRKGLQALPVARCHNSVVEHKDPRSVCDILQLKVHRWKVLGSTEARVLRAQLLVRVNNPGWPIGLTA